MGYRLFVAVATVALLACPAWADRPGAAELLPESTLAFLRIRDAQELVEKFQQTNGGKMFQDEEIQPLLEHLYGSAKEAYGDVEERVGLSLDQLLALPQGEISIAVVAPTEGPPAIAILFEAGDNVEDAKSLLARGEELAAEGGVEKTTEKIGDVTLNIYEGVGPQNRTMCQFEKEGVIGITSDVALAEVMLNIWTGRETEIKTLAEKDEFNTIMSKCQGTKDEPPQLAFFVDPVNIARTVSRGNVGAQTAMALLPALGLDGLKGIGGSVILAAEEFDTIAHIHVSLDSPRAGAIEALALDSGDTTPEDWVPNDVVSYNTICWDVKKTFLKTEQLYDSFTSEGELRGMIESNISREIGVDAVEDIIMQVDGRGTWISWIEPPARINSQANLIALRVKDREAAWETVSTILGNDEERYEEREFKGVTYFYDTEAPDLDQQRRERIEAREGDPEAARIGLRSPTPCVGLLDDYIVGTDSEELLKKIITTKSRPENSLAKDLEYKAVAAKIRRHSKGGKPGMIRFERPDAALKNLYDVVVADDTRATLSRQAENNRFFQSLDSALTEHPLPDFEVLKKYVAPTGAMLTNDDTGFHYMLFSLKRETEE